jgi:predicted ATPase/class 3 adenylate cyclase
MQEASSVPPPASGGDAVAGTNVRTFLIADVRGYTRYTLEHGDAAAAKLAEQFAEIARDVVSAGGGEVIEVRGDEVLAVFNSTRNALVASTELQQRYRRQTDEGIPFHVGIGLDAGEAIPVQGGYRGAALNLAARLCSLAGPGEILTSDALVHLARKIDGVNYAERGFAQLKGFSDPVRVIEIVSQQSAASERGAEGERTAEHRLPIGGFLGSLPSGLLVGRDEELAQALERVEAVAGGTGQLVLLAGEPGVGKTRLAQEVTLQLRNREFLLAAGRCYEPQQTAAFYPFFEALTTLLESAPADIRSHAGRRWPYLGQLLPDQIPMHAVASEGADDQQRLFRAVTGFLQALAESSPVALLLDDLHWADPSTLELLQHLARQTRADRVLLFGTYRDVEVGRQHPLEGALRDLMREGLLTRIDVARLEQDGTAALIGEAMGEEKISPQLAGLIHRRTDGNPFFVQQVMRALVEKGDIYREAGRWERKAVEDIEVPESVRSVIGQRLSRLKQETQALLREAAVLGQTFNFEEFQTATGHEEADIEAALEEASRAGIARPLQKDEYAFDHALTQQALYAELSPRRRRKLHLAAGEALEQLPEASRTRRASELAWHFLQADEPDRAIVWSLRAGDRASLVFAHSEAELQYRTALELAKDTEDEIAEVEALEKLGKVLQIVGRYDESLEVLELAVKIWERRGDRNSRARLFRHIGNTHAERGTAEDGIARVSSFLSQMEESGGGGLTSGELAGLYVALCHLYFSGGRWHELTRVAERAIQLAEAAGDVRLRAEAENRLGIGLIGEGSPEDARSAHERALALAEQSGDLVTAGKAANNLAVIAFVRDANLRRHLEYRQLALEMAERAGDLGSVIFGAATVCAARTLVGEWEEARRDGERAVALARSVGRSWSSSYAFLWLGYILLWQGEEEQARPLFSEAMAIAEQGEDLQGLETANELLGDYEMSRGNPKDVIARWRPAIDRAEAQGRPNYPPSLAWAYMESGDEVKAMEILTLQSERCRREQNDFYLAAVLLVSAMLARRQGRREDAERDLEEGLELVRKMEYQLGEALLLQEYGRLLVASAETESAAGTSIRLWPSRGALEPSL